MPRFDFRDAFQRCLALIFFLAFCGFYGQSPELVSDRGVEPLVTIVEQRRVPGDLLESFSGTPTLLWLLDALNVGPSAGSDLVCVFGGLLSAAAALFPRVVGGCTPLFVALSLLYLSLVAPLAATARGSAIPWAELAADGLLLEAAFAGALWAPLWPKGSDEGEEEREGGGGGLVDPSAPALAPAFLLRWVAAKNALYRGLSRRKGLGGSSPFLVAAEVAVAPLALSPSRLPRLVAAAALLSSWLADAVASSSPLSLSSAWASLLRLALVVPLLHAGVLDDERGNDGTPSTKAKAARAAVSALSLVPALFSSVAVASSPKSTSSLESSLARFAPWCLAAAGATMAASLAADVLRSMSSASIGEEGEEGAEGEERRRPKTLSQRVREEGQERKRRRPQYVRGTHEPALIGAISVMLFAAGCFELSSVISSTPSAGGGCSGSGGCGGGPAALVVARRLSWLARPWRATGPSFQAVFREEGEGRRADGIAIEVKSEGCVGGAEGDERGEDGLWTRLSPRSSSSRVALALSTSFSPPAGGADPFPAPPPWLDHLLYRLVSDPDGPVAASFVPESRRRPPCAARAVVVVVDSTKKRKRRTWASATAREALDASSAASERLARHGWGPLVRYEEPSAASRFVAALARPPSVASAGGAGASAFVLVASAAAAVALAGRRRRRSPPAAAAATAAATASKKRD